jgi:hypothetical protein
VSVADYIAHYANCGREHRIADKRPYNTWWGVADNKWLALYAEGIARGYLPSDLPDDLSDLGRGTCEWIASLEAVNDSRVAIADRLYELSYESLLARPEPILRELAQFLELPDSDSWIVRSIRLLRPANHSQPDLVILPACLVGPFNSWQDRLGYRQRARTPTLAEGPGCYRAQDFT